LAGRNRSGKLSPHNTHSRFLDFVEEEEIGVLQGIYIGGVTEYALSGLDDKEYVAPSVFYF
jgi:hypothetical protein